MRSDDYYRHARPKWMVQEEWFRKAETKRRRYRLIRQGIEYGAYIAFVIVFVFMVLWAISEGGL